MFEACQSILRRLEAVQEEVGVGPGNGTSHWEDRHGGNWEQGREWVAELFSGICSML